MAIEQQPLTMLIRVSIHFSLTQYNIIFCTPSQKKNVILIGSQTVGAWVYPEPGGHMAQCVREWCVRDISQTLTKPTPYVQGAQSEPATISTSKVTVASLYGRFGFPPRSKMQI